MTKPLQDARLSIDSERLQELLQFPLVEALFGRRSRRFFRGAEIPDGPLAYKSKYEPEPLDDLEKILILLAVGGVTGWHHSITRHDRYKPHLSNYSGSATGRTFLRPQASIRRKFSSPMIPAPTFSKPEMPFPKSRKGKTASTTSSN